MRVVDQPRKKAATIMPDYEAREAGQRDGWALITSAINAEDAARRFAEQRDNDSGGEVFQMPGRDEMQVTVRRVGGGDSYSVHVSFDYVKRFRAQTECVLLDEEKHAEGVT